MVKILQKIYKTPILMLHAVHLTTRQSAGVRPANDLKALSYIIYFIICLHQRQSALKIAHSYKSPHSQSGTCRPKTSNQNLYKVDSCKKKNKHHSPKVAHAQQSLSKLHKHNIAQTHKNHLT